MQRNFSEEKNEKFIRKNLICLNIFAQNIHCECNIVMPAFGFWDSDLVTCGLKKLVCNLLELLIGSLEINLGDEQCFCWSLED